MGWKAAGLIRISGLENGTDVDVLEAIATFLNEDDGHCFPALTSVMVVARKSRNVVRQSIKDLTEQGLLSFSEEPGKVRSYVIHFQNLPEPKLKKAFEEFFRRELRKKTNPVQKITGFRSEPGNEVNREGVQKCTPTGFRSEPPPGSEVNPEQGNNKEQNKEENREVMCAPASQALPTSFPQSSNSQNHSETKTAGKDSLPNASERSVAAHRDRPDTSDEQTRQNDAGCSQNASTRISGVCPENEPPPMSDEDLENLFANAQLEECPPFPEKGDHPSEKDAHLSSGDKKPARKKPATTAFCAVPRPDDVDPQVWSDWMAVRKRKNKPLTETAFNFLKSQAEKAGISTARAIELCAQNGWLGFREEYLRNSFSRNLNSYQPAMKTPIKRKRAEDYVWKVK